MHVKATIVAYAFSVRCFENITLVAYVGLRVNVRPIKIVYDPIMWDKMAVSYSFLRDDNIVKTEGDNFIALC